MRAIVLREHGGPEVLRSGRAFATAVPAKHQILVEVHATSVNPVDAKVRRGGSAARTMPIVLGYDASGVVRDCGPDVEGWNVGDAVFGCPNLFGAGANADYVLLDARAAGRKPSTIDHATAACLPLVSLTAWEALHDRARIGPGQTLLIHAGAGGVGHIAIQLPARDFTAVASSPPRGAQRRSLFAADTLGAGRKSSTIEPVTSSRKR